MKYLIAGLGNIGEEYENTRHNIGFTILDAWSQASNFVFNDKRYGSTGLIRYKSRSFILLKPSTLMNRSGNAINYWLQKEKIPIENLLIVVDDISIPFGSMRLRPKGGDGGHNGLAHIISILGHGNFARLRFGIGNGFSRGRQADYVLGNLSEIEENILKDKLKLAVDIIKSFGTIGLELTMTKYNKQAKLNGSEEIIGE